MVQLERRVQERDRFLAVLGHELRNPLGAILLASQMRDANGRLNAEHAQLIERQARHLTRLVNDLLDLSRVAAGKITLKRQIVDVRRIAAESVRVAEPLAQRQGIRISLIEHDKPLLVNADPVRVDQMIANIVTNAIKYTPEGGHVKVALIEEADHAVIQVTDDGVGIAPERIAGIFELFAQAENAIGRAQGGMGIGLALVRNLVRLHGGDVSAKSDGLGKGSEFKLRLPLADGAKIPAEIKRARRQASDSASRRIVIVEDNADVRKLLHYQLESLGHSVYDAADGDEGLREVLDKKPDLVLLDLGLPGVDGFHVAREVRSRMGGDIVLVAISGFGRPEDKRRAMEAGFDEHVTKPADIADIETILRRFPPRAQA
jgi:CheY-like chemotaxis protein